MSERERCVRVCEQSNLCWHAAFHTASYQNISVAKGNSEMLLMMHVPAAPFTAGLGM